MAFAFVRNNQYHGETMTMTSQPQTKYAELIRLPPSLHIPLRPSAEKQQVSNIEQAHPSIRFIATEEDRPVSACGRVLGTTELHEQILLKLPLRSILRAQAMSRTWRNLVLYSPIVRQALFLAPAKPTMVWTLVDKEVQSPTGPGGSGLMGPAAGLQELDKLLPIDEADANGAEYVVQAKVNGIVPYRHLHFSQRLDSSHAVWSFCRNIHLDGPPAETAFSANVNAIQRMHPTYRQMYLSQPPCKVVEIGVYGGRSQALIEKIVCEDGTGVRFQHVLDAVGKLQATRTIACLEVALWMKDVCFEVRRPEPPPAIPLDPLSLEVVLDGI